MSTLLRVPYVDLSRQHASIKDELLAAVARVIDRGDFVLGADVEIFEREFAQMCGVRNAVGVNSGMDALVLALRVLDLQPGDEVITAPNSFVASASCIGLLGGRPVFVDVDASYNLDPALIESAITPRTKGILPVHLTGRPAAMERIREIADQHGLFIIEDAAQAVMAERHGRRVGSWGTIGCFSLHPLKTLNACGDGGVLTTDDDALAERLRIMRNLGLRSREDCVEFSQNSRLDTIQAAMLIVKLRHLADWTTRRRANARYYSANLADIPELQLPFERPDEIQVFHTYVVQAENRDRLREHLTERGIGTTIHYPVPIHLQTVGLPLGYVRGDFPVTESQATKILSLPIHQNLGRDELEHVVAEIRAFYSA